MGDSVCVAICIQLCGDNRDAFSDLVQIKRWRKTQAFFLFAFRNCVIVYHRCCFIRLLFYDLSICSMIFFVTFMLRWCGEMQRNEHLEEYIQNDTQNSNMLVDRFPSICLLNFSYLGFISRLDCYGLCRRTIYNSQYSRWATKTFSSATSMRLQIQLR
jgi:hypothetical protein